MFAQCACTAVCTSRLGVGTHVGGVHVCKGARTIMCAARVCARTGARMCASGVRICVLPERASTHVCTSVHVGEGRTWSYVLPECACTCVYCVRVWGRA